MIKMTGSALLLVAFSALLSQVLAEKIIVTNGKWTEFTTRPKGFVRMDENEKCDEGFPGIRFWIENDPSLIRIEDNEGNYVGNQVGILKKDVEKVIPEGQRDATIQWYESTPQIDVGKIGEEPAYLMTGYIYDPKTVCSGPQTEPSTCLYIRDKSDDKRGYREVDRSTDEQLKDNGWDKNPCIPTMGDHYRPTLPAVDDSTCTGWSTPFLLYNHQDHKNIGWGWQFPGNFTTTNFEHADRGQFSGIIKPMPDCIMKSYDDNVGYSSQHVYVIDTEPKDLNCK